MSKKHFTPAWVVCALSLLFLLVACRGQPAPAPTPETPAGPANDAPLPEANSTILIEPETGGSIRLRGGASILLPAQALSQKAAVTLRVANDFPPVPIPRSLLGQAYEFTLEGGEMTGLALARLPVPPTVSAEEYDVAPYRWNGSTWERMNGRLVDGEIQIGLNGPALLSVQGQWNLADASLTLVRDEAPPGQPRLPLRVAGQYRYSALPMLSGDVVPATLRLKQDISGGAGRIAGNEALDATVDEAVLWFKPDPTTAQARIEFSHIFELDPAEIDLAPGTTTRFYAVLVVEDSAAPTRRMSTGVEYAQVLPIRIVGRTIVRPQLLGEERYSLRWNVRLNDRDFAQLPATNSSLSVDQLIDQGGLGSYKITLEANLHGAWQAVSNDVSIQLALRPTATPEPGEEPPLVAQVSPTPGVPAASGTQPIPPTRRPGPAGGGVQPGGEQFNATPTPTLDLMPTVTPTATRPGTASVFWADRYTLAPGECTVIHWQVENVISVFFNNEPVTGQETRQVCPTQTTTYQLRVNVDSGAQDRTLTITVATPGEAPIEFTADAYQIKPGECTTLHWRVTNVRAVRLNGQGVAGEADTSVCPETTTDYVLEVEDTTGNLTTRKITINVVASDMPLIRFWADRYALAAGGCTGLHWRVENVQQVRLDGNGVNGIGGTEVCPGNGQFYTLQIITAQGLTLQRRLNFTSGDPGLAPGQVIAQGVVRDVSGLADIDDATPGDQFGYKVTIDGLNVLFNNAAGWSEVGVVVGVPQSMTASADAPLHWPISSPQLVEFRAVCDNAQCRLAPELGAYLYLRSE